MQFLYEYGEYKLALTRLRTLLIDEINELETVKGFLNSKSRNSQQTRRIYGFALSHFQTFLSNSEYKDYNVETILEPLRNKELDVYVLLESFLKYLETREDIGNSNTKLSRRSIITYLGRIRSYLQSQDIDINPVKFKDKLNPPRIPKKKRSRLSTDIIRKILLACDNARLKAFIAVLATSGMRAGETLGLRNCDVYFKESPTRIHILAENTKTKEERDIYITDEASEFVKIWLQSKYSEKDETIIIKKWPNHIIFTKHKTEHSDPAFLYRRLHHNFIQVLNKIEMNQRKDGQGVQRRKKSFHSFRSFVKTIISDHAGQDGSDYSEYILGHSNLKTDYYGSHEDEAAENYKKCMKYLTFLDYPTVDSIGKDFVSKLAERDQEMMDLKSRLKDIEKERDHMKESRDMVDQNRLMVTRELKQRDKVIEKLNHRLEIVEEMKNHLKHLHLSREFPDDYEYKNRKLKIKKKSKT
jgi:integrase